MKVELDPIIVVGKTAVAALSKSSVHSCGAAAALSLHGAKRPVAILIHQNNVTTAFGIDGTQLSLHELDQRYPGKRMEFDRRVRAIT